MRFGYLGVGILGLMGLAGASACSDDEACSDSGCGGGDTTSSSTSATTTSSVGGMGTGGAGGSGGGAHSVTVLVTDVAGEPISTDVIVNAADGAVLTEAQTDASGQVVVEIPAGGSVSAYHSSTIYEGQSEVVLNMGQTAFIGDAAPTTIVLVPSSEGEVEPAAATMNVQTLCGPKENTGSYELITSCSMTTSASANITTTVPGCTNDGLYDLVLVARGFSGELRDYRIHDDQPFSANGTSTHNLFWPGSSVANVPYNLSNLPPSASTVSVLSTSTKKTHGTPMTLQAIVSHPNPSADITGSVTQATAFGTEHCLLASVQASGEWRNKKRCRATPDLSPLQFNVSRLAVFESASAAAPAIGWDVATEGELGDELELVVSEQQGNVRTVWSGRVAPVLSAGQVVRPDVPANLNQFLTSQTVAGSVLHKDIAGVSSFAEALGNTDWSSLDWTF